MSTAGRPRHGDAKRSLGEKRRREVEQAVARDWSVGRCVAELGVTEAQYWAVRHAMDQAVEVG